MAGFDAFKAIDFHFLEESAAFGELVAEERRVGVFGIDCLATAHAASEANDDHLRPVVFGFRSVAGANELRREGHRGGGL